MNFIDAHVHLLGKKIFSQWDFLSEKWSGMGIDSLIHMSSTLNESQKALDLFKDKKNILIGVGKHPWKIKNYNEEEKNIFEDLIANSRCKVIGEVGLDYYAIKDSSRYDYQKSWFKFFVEMSNKYKKSLNVHVTGAESDIYKILCNHWDKRTNVNIHWYSGSEDVLKNLIDLGCFFSINPAIYYSIAHQKTLSNVPLDRLLTESDGDVFYKKMNLLGEPSIIPLVIDKISEFLSIERTELQIIVVENLKNYLSN